MRTLILVTTASLALNALAEPPKSTPELIEKGKKAYAMYCVACHGEKGLGDGPAAVALNPKPRDFTKEPLKQGEKPEELFKTLATGIPATAMVGFGHVPEEDRWGIVYHVLALRPAAPAGKAEAKAPVGKPPPAPKAPTPKPPAKP